MKNYFLILFFSCLMSIASFPADALTTRGEQIVDSEGKTVELKGVNWFGFNNGQTMVDGLWGGSALNTDFSTVAYRMKLLGFNAVRLPFSFKDLNNLNPRNFSNQCQKATLEQIQGNVTNPDSPPPEGSVIPPLEFPPNGYGSGCNNYLPNDTTFNRFVWVVNYLAQNGFYVLLDNHLREDQTAIENPQEWVDQWVKLVQAVSQQPATKDKILIDILNEPDNYGIRWEQSGDKPALKDLYLSAMDAIYAVNPDVLFLIEGTGQGGIDANWGDGFATDPQLIQQYGLSDPNPFFKAVVKKEYANQVVVSPHVYPPSVTFSTKNATGEGLANRLTSSFGYLTKKGYCTEDGCKKFPVAVGEFGSRFKEQNDISSMKDMAAYFNNTGTMADGKHEAIPNWFYWSWNANSGDTGGIVEDDWVRIIWKKIDYLLTVGLKPWYLDPSKEQTPPKTPEETPPKVEEPTPTPLPVPDPTPAPSPELPPSQGEIKEGVFSIKVELGDAWETKPGLYSNTVNLTVTNTGDKPIPAPWTIHISNSFYQEVTQFWNMKVLSFEKGTIVAEADQEWQALAPNGENSVNLGFIVESTNKDFVPKAMTINGTNYSLLSVDKPEE